MPRGTRAQHENNGMGWAGDQRVDPTLLPVAPTIEVACWCDTWAVVVPWVDFRFLGETRSCGKPWCVGPSGQAVVGERAGGLYTDTQGRDAWHRRQGVEGWFTAPNGRMFDTKTPPKAMRYTHRAGSMQSHGQEVAARRDIVAGLYAAGLNARDLSTLLGVPLHTIKNDIHLARTQTKEGNDMSMNWNDWRGSSTMFKFDNPGATIVGTVVAVRVRPSTNGDCPVVTIKDDGGTEWDVWAGNVNLQAKLAELAPGVADRISILFTGYGEAQPGKSAPKLFDVAVKAAGSAPTPAMTPAPPPQPAAPAYAPTPAPAPQPTPVYAPTIVPAPAGAPSAADLL